MNILKKLADLKVTVIGLVLLLILTIWGTLYQADYGLYQAQQKFYSTWFFLAGGFFPFPGAQFVCALLIVNLAAALIYLFATHRAKFSMVFTHAGLLLMLGAGGVTFYFGEESYLAFEEQEAMNTTTSYRDWEIAAWSGSDNRREVTAIDSGHLKSGDLVPDFKPGLALQVEWYYPNCSASGSGDTAPELTGSISGSGVTSIREEKRNHDPNADRPGALVTLLSGNQEVARLALLGEEPSPAIVSHGGEEYAFMLRRKRTPIPATIRLIDFKKVMYPGTQIAKSYSSRVMIDGEGMDREVLISMNKPLRLEGFTFYQSSYRDLPGGRESSTLSVVKNYGRTMPYVATGVTVVGMILHFTGMLVGKARKPTTAGKEIS